MQNYEQLFRYVGIGSIVLLLFGLGGWYLFISHRTASIESSATSRGFSIDVPSFGGTLSSTAANIALGFNTSDATPEEGPKGVARPPRLWRVNATPVAGAAFVQHGSTTVLRFVERSTGNVFDADVETGAIVRRTNTTMTKTYRAAVSDAAIILQQLDGDNAVTAFSGAIATTTAEDGSAALEGKNLGSGMRDIAIQGGSLFFLTTDEDGTHLVQSGLDGSKATEIATTAVGGFNVLALADGRIMLSERAASGIPGYAYAIGKGGALDMQARYVAGLTFLPRTDSSAALIGSDTGSSLSLSVRANKDAAPLTLPIQTIAEKCVWAPGSALTAYCAVPRTPTGANFLDNWYRGTIHLADTWYKVDGSSGTANVFFTTDINTRIDVEEPAMDANGSYLAFVDAHDKSLWVLRIDNN